VVGLLLITVSLFRLAVVVPDWLNGAAPSFQGQYERRLLSSLTSVPLLSIVMLCVRSGAESPNRGRRILMSALVAMSVTALLVDVGRG
jgi:hypothetical protein